MIATKALVTASRPRIRNRLAPILSGRRGLIVLAGLVIVAGLALNWGWLVAAGIAPLLVAALPCLAMCALGLCMMGRNMSCSTSAPKTVDTPSETPRGYASKLPAEGPPAVRAVEPTDMSRDATAATRTEVQPIEERKVTHA